MSTIALHMLLSGAPMHALTSIRIGMDVTRERGCVRQRSGASSGHPLPRRRPRVLVTGLEAWGSLARWLGIRSVTTLAAGFPLSLAVAVAGLS